jgi:hypothetical protein
MADDRIPAGPPWMGGRKNRMLELVPHNVLSWDFSVLRDGFPVAEIDVSWFREKGMLTVDGVHFPVPGST